MRYRKIKQGVFIERPNRFIGKVLIDGVKETVHIKNTGRCKELLVKECRVFLNESDNPSRKTKYDLVAVEKKTQNGTILINMDSQIPNDAVYEWLQKGELFSKSAVIRREVKYNNSRFDFYVEDNGKRIFLEVKGVTLENDGIAMFPDAPTERGVKHINELCHCIEDGYCAYVIFVIQMKGVHLFKPNIYTHPEFADALKIAANKGVGILAYDCIVTESSIEIDKNVQTNI